jgi:hypothetical protein
MNDDIRRASIWAADFALRFPEVTSIYLVGSRATGRAKPESDYDVIVRVGEKGTLTSLETLTPNPVGGWLLPDDADALRFAPNEWPCDICVVFEPDQDADTLELFLRDAVVLWIESDTGSRFAAELVRLIREEDDLKKARERFLAIHSQQELELGSSVLNAWAEQLGLAGFRLI